MARKRKNQNYKFPYVETKKIVALDYTEEIELDIKIDHDIFDTISTYDTERFIYFLPSREVEVLLLRNIGYESFEIVEILGLKNISEYYSINKDIRIHAYLFDLLSKDPKLLV